MKKGSGLALHFGAEPGHPKPLREGDAEAIEQGGLSSVGLGDAAQGHLAVAIERQGDVDDTHAAYLFEDRSR